MGMGMGGAITAVAATTTVGIGAATMAGGMIAIGGDFYPKTKKGLQSLVAAFPLNVAINEFRSSVASLIEPVGSR
ncbi:hypothetical protein [Bradyrhizobium neotropicale]|uniref:hypothetical protein n=1 Tax=Bradyrhizobium neotropicale TaxID=1497615 RepID=UPI001AD65168|nr:hypothetical protein [Bradyrhizobium neotropicale]MBO4223765.1 hypothetical protein [Bradyrhizobium neotropicale]